MMLCRYHEVDPTFAADLFVRFVRARPRKAALAMATLAHGDDRAVRTSIFLLRALGDVDEEAVYGLLELEQ